MLKYKTKTKRKTATTTTTATAEKRRKEKKKKKREKKEYNTRTNSYKETPRHIYAKYSGIAKRQNVKRKDFHCEIKVSDHMLQLQISQVSLCANIFTIEIIVINLFLSVCPSVCLSASICLSVSRSPTLSFFYFSFFHFYFSFIRTFHCRVTNRRYLPDSDVAVMNICRVDFTSTVRYSKWPLNGARDMLR